MALDSRVLDVAEEEEKMFVFAISLLGATIQDSGTRKKSNDIILASNSKFKIRKINRKYNKNEKRNKNK